MQITKLLKSDENRAVSPVIGVILMVAITVILAAVIGTFVLGLGDQVQQTTPSAQFSYDFQDSGSDVVITHEGGDGIPADQLEVTDGTNTDDWANGGSTADPVVAGSSFDSTDGSATVGSFSGGETVRVIWSADDGDRTATLANRDVPE